MKNLVLAAAVLLSGGVMIADAAADAAASPQARKASAPAAAPVSVSRHAAAGARPA